MKMTFWLTAVAVVFLSIASVYHNSAHGQTPPPKSPELLSKGKKLYQDKCASCHGAQGNGQTSMAKVLKPPPRDFTQPLKDWPASRGEPGSIYKVIKEGVPNSAMLKFDLPDEDVWALVYTVMEFGK
jgi:high-affinity iron transporter